MHRPEMIAALREKSDRFDFLVIGGGATGLGAAVDAASRGYRVALVEGSDFASGTSSRSTKLVHGGVRYLQQGRFGMVRHSLHERERLLHNAPSLVHPIDFLLPIKHWWQKPWYFAGLRLYDLLAGQSAFPRTRCLNRDQSLQRLPNLNTAQLRNSVVYSDGQFDDARLAVCLAQTAVHHGAIVCNYLSVVRLLFEHKHVAGAVVRDQESGDEFPIHARVVLNCTGVFAESILNLDCAPEPADLSIAPSRGTHIVVDADFLPGRTALIIPKTDDGRVLFAVPWQGKVILGTTDVEVPEITQTPAGSTDEIGYLLDHAQRWLLRAPDVRDIRAVFSGLRPLFRPRNASGNSATLSREHTIRTSSSGLISVIGGKWTTYRQMAEDLINVAESHQGWSRRECRTRNLSVDDDHRVHPFPAHVIPTPRTSDTQAHEQPGQLNAESTQALRQWVDHCVRYEMARTPEDLLARRCRLLFLDAHSALSISSAVSLLLAESLGQTTSWATNSQRQLAAFAQSFLPPG